MGNALQRERLRTPARIRVLLTSAVTPGAPSAFRAPRPGAMRARGRARVAHASSSTCLSSEPQRAPPPPRLTRRRAAAAAAVLAWAALAVAARLAGRAHVQRLMASFEPGAPLAVSPESAAAHAALMVVDLHCDASWVPRDLLQRAEPSRCGLWHCERSHVDVPRLVAGNVALQVFTAFTQVPSAPRCEGPIPLCDPLPVGNSNASFDSVSALVPFSGYPLRALHSLLERALHQARRVRSAAARSGGALTLILSAAELDAYVARRAACLRRPGGCPFTAGLLGVEGAHALEGELSNLDVIFGAGFRLLGLQHFADNDAGGSLHGAERGGLTPWGQELLRRCEQLGIAVDLAHASEAVIADALRIASKPLLVSHTGAAGHCPSGRTLPDALLRDVAAAGGVIGIGFWSEVTCGATADAIADAVAYTARLVGPRHVALGSDWDGCVAVPPGLDAAGMAQITHALRQRGFAGDDLAGIMGQNALRLLRAALQPKP